MRHAISIALALFVGAHSQSAGGDSDEDRAEKKKLQGTWRVIAAEAKGEVAPQKDIEEMEIIFSGDAIVVREGTKVQERFVYKLDVTKAPKTIDFTFTEGKKKGRTDRGIYLLDGNDLKICIQEDKDALRPRDFTTRPGTELSLVILRRFK